MIGLTGGCHAPVSYRCRRQPFLGACTRNAYMMMMMLRQARNLTDNSRWAGQSDRQTAV